MIGADIEVVFFNIFILLYIIKSRLCESKTFQSRFTNIQLTVTNNEHTKKSIQIASSQIVNLLRNTAFPCPRVCMNEGSFRTNWAIKGCVLQVDAFFGLILTVLLSITVMLTAEAVSAADKV